MYETALQTAFVRAFNQLIDNKDEILLGYETVPQTLTDTTALEKKHAELQSEYDVVMELMRKCVEENARTKLDQDEYNQRYNALADRYQTAQNDIAETDSKLAERAAKREKITRFLADLKQRDGVLDEFDEKLWLATV